MTIQLCSLALNEMEHLPNLYAQHKDWPDLVSWVFVEGADHAYAQANPANVSPEGLSVDGTSAYLRELAARDSRVTYIPHGFARHRDPAQQKCESRNRYLEVADEVKPDYFVVLDADEFYCRAHQARINQLMRESAPMYRAWIFGLRTIWRPESIASEPLFAREAVGCLFSVPICRGWRWLPGVRYKDNHNTPQTPDGVSLMAQHKRYGPMPGVPYCVHMGFTSSLASRKAKSAYYVARGEGQTDHRRKFVDCRKAHIAWKPGSLMPHGSRIQPYDGIIPEVFREGQA